MTSKNDKGKRNLAREFLGDNGRDKNEPRNVGNKKNLGCFRNEGRSFACAEGGVSEGSWVGWGSRQRPCLWWEGDQSLQLEL